MRTVSALLIFLVLAACDSSNETDMARCHAQASRSFASEQGAYSGDLDDYYKLCMVAKGYHFSAMPYACGRDDPYGDAECYVRWN